MIVDYDKAVADAKFLFLTSPYHRNHTPEELYSGIELPCKHNSIRLYYRKNRPIGLVTWGWLDRSSVEPFLHYEYLPKEEDYQRSEDKELWGFDLIAPYGDGSQVFKNILKECKDQFGNVEVKWRRVKTPLKVNSKCFK